MTTYTLNEAESAVRAYFNNAWAKTTAIAWPDSDFKKPNNESWVRFNMNESFGKQSSMGAPSNNRFRHEGIIILQIFTPQGNSSLNARALADSAISIFLGKEANGIRFFDVTANTIGNDGHGWHQINVLISYQFDQIA